MQGGCRATLANHDVLWQLLQGLAHRTDELELSLQHGICLDRLGEKFAILDQDLKEVLRD